MGACVSTDPWPCCRLPAAGCRVLCTGRASAAAAVLRRDIMETFSVVIPLYALSPEFLVPYDK